MRAYGDAIGLFVASLGLSPRPVRLKMIFATAVLVFHPIVDIYVISIITSFIFDELNHGPDTDFSETVNYSLLLIVAFLFSLNQVFNYFANTQRIVSCNAVFESLEKTNTHKKVSGWFRLLLLECSQQFVFALQIAFLCIFCMYTNRYFGTAIFLIFLCNFAAYVLIFKREFFYQKQLRFNRKERKSVLASQRVLSRVKSAEAGVLLSSGFLAILVVFLIAGFKVGFVEAANCIIFLFVIRIYASTMRVLSGSLMRLARAQSYIFENAWQIVAPTAPPGGQER